jgi:hypothetical protein
MLTIHLDGLLEDRLKLAAASRGEEPTALARKLLDRDLPPAETVAGSQMKAIESFIAGMTDSVSKNVPADHFADEERERIYQERGG